MVGGCRQGGWGDTPHRFCSWCISNSSVCPESFCWKFSSTSGGLSFTRWFSLRTGHFSQTAQSHPIPPKIVMCSVVGPNSNNNILSNFRGTDVGLARRRSFLLKTARVKNQLGLKLLRRSVLPSEENLLKEEESRAWRWRWSNWHFNDIIWYSGFSHAWTWNLLLLDFSIMRNN